MKSIVPNGLVFTFLFALATSEVIADEEQDLLRVLQSDAGIPAKAEACKRLRLMGTARSVPILEPLLGEERISQAARYALEAMPVPEATEALRRALMVTSGPAKLGVIDSLGWRRDAESIPLLRPLLSDADPAIATASVVALGRMGGSEATAALQAARGRTNLHAAVVNGLLASAERSIADGRHAEAVAIYQSLFVPAEEEAIRTAAYVGWIRAAGDGGIELITSALNGNDPVAQAAALKMAASVKTPSATRAFADMLPRSTPALQIALLAVLQKRGDSGARTAVLEAARSADVAVRSAAIAALGAVGDATDVPFLAESAASNEAVEQAAARDALATLHRGDVTAALLSHIDDASPGVQRELFGALVARADTSAVPALLALAGSQRPSTHDRAMQALGNLADGHHLAGLVQLLAAAKDASARDDIRGVFETVVERYGDTSSLDTSPILKGISEGAPETRKALLQVAALFVDPRVREAYRRTLQSGDEELRSAAAQGLCVTRDAGMLPDLIEIARRASDEGLKSKALEGAVRLAMDDNAPLTVPQRIEAFTSVYPIAVRTEDKRTVLSGLSHLPHRAALDLAERSCLDPSVKAEAEAACLQIARGMGSSEFAAIEPTLARLAAGAVSHSVQTNAQALLKSLQSNRDKQ